MRAKVLMRYGVVLACAIAALAPAACDNSLPGTTLGTYGITGTLTTNTCGAPEGIALVTPWNFSVALSQSGSTIYWSTEDGSPLLSGTETSDNHLSITATQASNVDGTDADAGDGVGPCTLERDDDYELALSAAAPTSFTGTLTYNYTIVSGSTCTDQLVAAGGTYTTLPCTIVYSLKGSKE